MIPGKYTVLFLNFYGEFTESNFLLRLLLTHGHVDLQAYTESRWQLPSFTASWLSCSFWSWQLGDRSSYELTILSIRFMYYVWIMREIAIPLPKIALKGCSGAHAAFHIYSSKSDCKGTSELIRQKHQINTIEYRYFFLLFGVNTSGTLSVSSPFLSFFHTQLNFVRCIVSSFCHVIHKDLQWPLVIVAQTFAKCHWQPTEINQKKKSWYTQILQ